MKTGTGLNRPTWTSCSPRGSSLDAGEQVTFVCKCNNFKPMVDRLA